jgi:hypothetical protein
MDNRTFAEKYEEVKRLRQVAFNLNKIAVKMQHPEMSDEEIENIVKKIFLYATT